MKRIVFSGIQPTGTLHIGNYFGTIRYWVELEKDYDCIFCIVDLHSITVPQDPQKLKKAITQTVCILLAGSGIDPKITSLFIQSHISAHSELAWILDCFTPMGWMKRMTQFKEKSDELKEQVSVGLFNYPALMAADILLYNTDLVPVGEDQKQHIEFTRDVAQKFNSIYGETFKIPEPLISKVGGRIMGLDDPTKKMSKSESNPKHAIYLLDSPDEIREKIMRATTDSLKEIRFDETRPGIYNLLTIYELFTNIPRQEIEAKFEGKGYSDLKKELAEIIIEKLRPIQVRYQELINAPDYIDSVLSESASKVRPIAQKTLRVVKEKIGLI